MAKCIASYSQRRQRLGCISRLYNSKRCFTCSSLLTRRSALRSFKNGCVVRVVKHLKGDWFIVLLLQLWLKITLYCFKNFITSVLKYRAENLSTYAHYYVSLSDESLFRLDSNTLRYLHCFNTVNHYLCF